jgi:hemoglobin-like flavoprotein
MNRSQIELIRRSWASVEASGSQLADRFYGRLFELDPSLKDLFTVTDMGSQNRKFIDMMREVVRFADDPDKLGPMLQESGRRHRGYGVRPQDYHTVGEAFLWAIEKGLPQPFDDDTQGAWAAGYSLIASIMRGAAERSAPS